MLENQDHNRHLKKKKKKSEYRSYFKMLENKISEIKITGGGLTENQVQNIVSNYVTAHKSELTGARGEKGDKGDKGVIINE